MLICAHKRGRKRNCQSLPNACSGIATNVKNSFAAFHYAVPHNPLCNFGALNSIFIFFNGPECVPAPYNIFPGTVNHKILRTTESRKTFQFPSSLWQSPVKQYTTTSLAYSSRGPTCKYQAKLWGSGYIQHGPYYFVVYCTTKKRASPSVSLVRTLSQRWNKIRTKRRRHGAFSGQDGALYWKARSFKRAKGA